jgi:hypothetical protein
MTSWKKRKKKKPIGYTVAVSPALRKRPWVSVIIRAEHYAMLRELGEFHDAAVGKIIGTLAVQEYLRTLSQSDPLKAMVLKEEYKNNDTLANQLLDI